jgi:predicted peroxiredoxin
MFGTFPRLKAAAAALALLAGLAAASPALAQQGRGPETLVTVVTSAEPQTQLMSMVLTMQALQQGAEVHVLLCGPGGDIALKDAPEGTTAPQAPMGMSPQGLMSKIMEAGGKVDVCALYLPNLEADASVLLDGVGVAKPPPMAEKLMAPRTRVLSF